MLKILIDMQGCQTESRFRGIGRHVDSLVHAMASQPQGHEIHLLLNGAFKDTVPTITHRFKPLLGEANIHIIDVVTPNALRENGNSWRNDASCLLREAYIDYIAPDVLFCSSFIEGYIDDSVLSVGRLSTVPVVPISYDLIPLIWKAQYLGHDARFDAYYYNRLEEMRSARGLIAISESSSQEAQTYLGFDAARVFTAPAAASEKFCKLELDSDAIVGLRAQFGITRAFMFYTGGADHRKNLGRLVQAYASLSPKLRSEYQLVFAGQVQPSEVLRLRDIGQQNGLQDTDMVFLGYVTDDDLVLLYNLAHLFVFPSLHEGFGLPALESMQCGTPVICGDTSSLPEVVTCPRALFDPLSVANMAEKMREVLEDSALHAELTAASLARRGAFSWDISAAIVLEALAKLISPSDAAPEHWAQTTARLDRVDARLFETLALLPHQPDERSRVDVLRLAQAMANNRVHAEAHLRHAVPDGVVSWRFEGPFDSSYSLALVNRELARAMAHLGHDVSMLSSEGPGDFAPASAFMRDNADLQQMYQRALTQQATAPHVTSRNMYPPRTSDMVSQNNALHNYAWEETGFPPGYVAAFNESLQFLTVTAEHVKKVLIDSGVKVPMAVVGNGVDHWLKVQADPSYVLNAAKVRLLHVSSCFPRKGADVLIESWGRAFTADDDVTLVIKTFDNPHNTIDQMLVAARKRFPNYPSVVVLKEDYTAEQLKALYEQCHILVAPSRAEGFGLPMAEAMLSGLHVITTGWSGQLDFCDSTRCDLIDFSFAHASTHEGVSSSVWVDPDPEHLAALMKRAAAECALPGAARPAPPPALLSEFSWDAVARRNVDAARRLTANRPIAQPRIGWISTYNTRCGIATYSEHLVSVLGLPVTVLATRSESKVRADEHYVMRTWNEGQEHGNDDILGTIEAMDLDVIVIQFNYGFFDFEKLNALLHKLNDQGRRVLVTLHATIDPAHAPAKKLALLVSGLARCARLLVHSIADLNRLKGYGLHHNAVLFPHGLLLPKSYDPRARAHSMDVKRLVIASYGFFLPHKGLIELIEACAILKQQGVAISLRLVNAEYPAPVSADLVHQARARVNELGLQNDVSMTTEFLSDDDSLRLLSDADMIVYPYQQTGESSSGAVRYGLALGTPVVVTPLSIFDDVSAAVFRLPGITPAAIASGLQDLADRLRSKTADTTEKMAAAQAWRDAHAYPVLGRRLGGMIEAIYGDRAST